MIKVIIFTPGLAPVVTPDEVPHGPNIVRVAFPQLDTEEVVVLENSENTNIIILIPDNILDRPQAA